MSLYGLYPSVSDDLFYLLFTQQYRELHFALCVRQDEKNVSERDVQRPCFVYVLYHGMTLLEIALLLHDTKAIQLLSKKHNRGIYYEQHSYTSYFYKNALELALDNKDADVVKTIWSLYHGTYKESIEKNIELYERIHLL